MISIRIELLFHPAEGAKVRRGAKKMLGLSSRALAPLLSSAPLREKKPFKVHSRNPKILIRQLNNEFRPLTFLRLDFYLDAMKLSEFGFIRLKDCRIEIVI